MKLMQLLRKVLVISSARPLTSGMYMTPLFCCVLIILGVTMLPWLLPTLPLAVTVLKIGVVSTPEEAMTDTGLLVLAFLLTMLPTDGDLLIPAVLLTPLRVTTDGERDELLATIFFVVAVVMAFRGRRWPLLRTMAWPVLLMGFSTVFVEVGAEETSVMLEPELKVSLVALAEMGLRALLSELWGLF